jgi:hypothetical protein
MSSSFTELDLYSYKRWRMTYYIKQTEIDLLTGTVIIHCVVYQDDDQKERFVKLEIKHRKEGLVYTFVDHLTTYAPLLRAYLNSSNIVRVLYEIHDYIIDHQNDISADRFKRYDDFLKRMIYE